MTQVNTYELLFQEDINVGVGVGTKKNPGGGNLVGTQVGIHTFAIGQAKVSAVWDPTPVNSLGTVLTTVTVAGAAVGDFVRVSFSLPLNGLKMWGEVTAANTVTVYLFNPTTSTVDFASGTLYVLVEKSR